MTQRSEQPTAESVTAAQKFICEMEGAAPSLTSSDFTNMKALAALLDRQKTKARLEEAEEWSKREPRGHHHACSYGSTHTPEGDYCDCDYPEIRRINRERLATLRRAALEQAVSK